MLSVSDNRHAAAWKLLWWWPCVILTNSYNKTQLEAKIAQYFKRSNNQTLTGSLIQFTSKNVNPCDWCWPTFKGRKRVWVAIICNLCMRTHWHLTANTQTGQEGQSKPERLQTHTKQINTSSRQQFKENIHLGFWWDCLLAVHQRCSEMFDRY